MKGLRILNSKTARSIFFIVFVGGLLTLGAVLMEFLWNSLLTNIIPFKPFTFLESVGILSFLYVIYFGIRFGKKKCKYDKSSEYTSKLHKNNDEMTDMFSQDFINSLSDKELHSLKKAISESYNKSITNQNFEPNLPHILKKYPDIILRKN